MPQPSNSASEPVNTESKSYFNLPLELLFYIVDFLSPQDVAALALCSKAFRNALGNSHWTSLSQTEREAFLKSLARDWPSYYFCHNCRSLHPLRLLKPPAPRNWTADRGVCVDMVGDMATWEYFRAISFHIPNYKLSFSHVQLAMARHYQGPKYGIPVHALGFTGVQICRPWRERLTILTSMEARVCSQPTSLCLRSQLWTVLLPHQPAIDTLSQMPLCIHLYADSPELSSYIKLQVSEGPDNLKNLENILQNTPSPVLICRLCRVHFQVEMCDLGEDGKAVVVTKWLDTGAGLTPDDPNWQIFGYVGLNSPHGHPEAKGVDSRFEDLPGLSKQSLLSLNASYLRRRRYEKVMKHPSPHEWYLENPSISDSRVSKPAFWSAVGSTLSYAIPKSWINTFTKRWRE